MPPENPLHALFERSRGAHRLLAVVAGSGQVARCAADGGADFLLVLNAGAYRTLGVGSLASFLAFGNANDQTTALLREQILPSSGGLPVVAGLLASDPTRPLAQRLAELRALGVHGITNWPAVSFVDGKFREAMESEGAGVAGEVEMLQAAAKAGFATLGFALEPKTAQAFTTAGVDALVLNLGLTREIADVKDHRDQLQRALVQLRTMQQAAASKTARPPLTLAFGGPATTPADLEQILLHSAVNGYAGGSVFERLPVRESVTATISHFKSALTSAPAADAESTHGEMIGRSEAMRQVFHLIERVAPRDVNIVLQGESGTGKELAAALLHRLSPRASRAFVTLNCGAITESLLESELFGHEKGAFTGAYRRRLGKFELAHHGTLFLDEIADLSAHAQVSLLRVLQQREITRVGGEESIHVDVRIISASHQNLAELVQAGRFRADLYYRLNGLTLPLPPLRDRPEDVELLAQAALKRLCVQWNLGARRLSAGFLSRLKRHPWPGNVRELQHVIGQALLLETSRIVDGRHFTPAERIARPLPAASATPIPGSKAEQARAALRQASGNKSEAARLLNVTRRTLYKWLEAEADA
jgi:two-component system response regulator HydG